MKRVSISFAGFVHGLLLTWACIYLISKRHWPVSTLPVNGCHELGMCQTSWWVGPTIIFALIGPAILFSVVNACAWQRWTTQKWLMWFGIFNVLIIALFLLLAI